MNEILKNAFKKALEKLNVGDIEIEINKPTLQENGDYSSNIAMKLARVLKKNPLEIANEIANNISDDNITKVEVKSPAFINFFVSKKSLIPIVIKFRARILRNPGSKLPIFVYTSCDRFVKKSSLYLLFYLYCYFSSI